jgi:hypothetical protein
LEEIGKSIGKSADEVRKMISAGQISADQGVQGILAAIQKTTGKPIGQAAAEASKSLGGLLARLEQIPEGLLMMAAPTEGLAKLKDALGNILAAFAPSTAGGQALSAAFGKMGDALGTFLSGLTGKKGASALESFATGIAGLVETIADMVGKIGAVMGPVLGGLISGLGKGLNAGKKAGAANVDTTESFVRLGEALGKVAEGIGTLLGRFAALFAADKANQESGAWLDDLMGKINAALGLINAISNAAQTVYAAATWVGTQLVSGIIAGINAAAPGLVAAVGALALLTTGTMASAHQIQSPSREWQNEIGYQLPAGEAEGIYKAAPLVTRAAQDVAANTTQARAGAGSALPIGAGSGPSVHIEQLIVYANGGPAQIAEQVRLRLIQELGVIGHA